MKLNSFIKIAIQKIDAFDSNLEEIIHTLFKNYLPDQNALFLTSLVPLSTKIIFYILVFMVPFFILKLSNPLNNKKASLVLKLSALVIAFLLFGIFLGFIQILFSFEV